MKILAIEKDLQPLPDDQSAGLLKEEARAVWRLIQQSQIRDIYFRADRTQAILILECGGEKEAGDILRTLPLVQKGYTAFDLIPLRPYPGLARLFEESSTE